MDEQRRTEQKERLEFRGGWGMSFLPAVIFLFFCLQLAIEVCILLAI